ncbi:hypothetical protein [Apilactobacillus micheneri]|uniref:Uncharacterized protein n=1 Tax=Apilactobacillus micheneri TaxID=1899430 RepID=A0A9Q8IM96_9LACO|nr:hypothetical protein [Apilactobacillus micheneri]TPR40633.1 hypothetical protein DY121_02365 [Apilactobacillus micheneri]TPR42100.1 hypothetical protein DY123_02605 [Apilactobacillus micheneri]TPR44755.1 hypothetical protein DY124_02345 [Apilactobacillus micheneri]TPR45054.1 hypothetical protein DY130_02360 [Apilactobacillus micheneri]TPR46396.1 hypothetical protein DY128_02360 [Apilactobacillus micheneri]
MIKNKFLIIISPMILLLGVTCFINNASANNKAINEVHSKKFTKHLSQYKNLAKKLSKQGYVYCINKNADFGTNSYPVIPYSNKDKKLVVNKKVRFKVQHIWSYQNGMSVNLISKNKKYNSWVFFPTDLYNIHSKDKQLKPLVSFAQKIFYNKVKNNKYNLNKLSNMANKIKSNKERKLGKQFVSQFDYFLLKKNNFYTLPTLLIGNLL